MKIVSSLLTIALAAGVAIFVVRAASGNCCFQKKLEPAPEQEDDS